MPAVDRKARNWKQERKQETGSKKLEARKVIVAGLDVGHSESSLGQGTVTPCPLLLIFLANSNATTTPPLPRPSSHLTTPMKLKLEARKVIVART
jgi:hypothetical protein